MTKRKPSSASVLIDGVLVTVVEQRMRSARSGTKECPHDDVDGRCSRWVEAGIPCDQGPELRRWVSEWQALGEDR